MAETGFTIKHMEARKMGRDAMKSITLHIDMRGVHEGLWGKWQWRRRVGKYLLSLGAAILRVGIKFDSELRTKE